jgi:hypothetical protein
MEVCKWGQVRQRLAMLEFDTGVIVLPNHPKLWSARGVECKAGWTRWVRCLGVRNGHHATYQCELLKLNQYQHTRSQWPKPRLPPCFG